MLLLRERLLRQRYPLAVACLLLVALYLRLYDVGWDDGQLFHPDERAIFIFVEELAVPWSDPGLLFDVERSPLNPRWFPYGSLPLYLLKAAAHLPSLVRPTVAGAELWMVGRVLSALFDVGTVLLTV